jgi:hypothetical protein
MNVLGGAAHNQQHHRRFGIPEALVGYVDPGGPDLRRPLLDDGTIQPIHKLWHVDASFFERLRTASPKAAHEDMHDAAPVDATGMRDRNLAFSPVSQGFYFACFQCFRLSIEKFEILELAAH